MASTNKYSWNARDYAKNSQNQYQWAQELIPKLKLCGDERLLDIGCGDGKITAELAGCLPHGSAVGIDSSAQMINLAKTSFPGQQHPNLSFQLMDARSLSFSEEFDLAFSNAALHWIVDQKAVLAGVHRALKPRGRLLFQMAGRGNAKAVLDILDELRVMEPWRSYFEGFAFPYAFLDAEEYRALLVDAGLDPVRVELFPRDMKFPSAEGMAGWVRTTWLPFTERVPPEKREGFVEAIVNHYLKEHPAGNDGLIHLGMMRLEVEAQKKREI
ncbi:MAG: methyltransferase domain-containing protein [Candidatus Bathyarchaeota archaeon]|nr:methyltransferase domain-containing protein [Candidatus Bathyarchaeota archaeon]